MTRDPWTGLPLEPKEVYEPYPAATCPGCGFWFELTDLEDGFCQKCPKPEEGEREPA